ncbi:MAG: hypothetical protein GY931_11960 [Maribacter sp.]|nr:hypothetical protein [Maribacter sp.]
MNTKKHFIKFSFFVIVAIFSMASTGWSTTYYVDATNGDNGNHGLSETKPWNTIGKVNASSFNPGDSILFKRGEIWKEMLTVPDAGQSGNPIIFGAYGSGNKPIITGKDYISGWDTSGNWSVYSSNIWSFSSTVNPRRIWLSGAEYKKAKTLADVDSTSRWHWDNNKGTLYVYSTSNPATFYSSIEVAYVDTTRYSSIRIIKKNYITVQNLDLHGGWQALSIQGSDYVIVEDCNIGLYNGHSGVVIKNSGANLSQYCELRNNVIDSGTRLAHDYEARLGYQGVSLHSGTQYCNVYGNTVTDWEHGGVVLQCSNASYPVIYNEVYDNTITAPSLDYGRALSTVSPAGTTLGLCAYNKIYRNYINNTTVRSQFAGDNNEICYNIFDTMPHVTWHTKEQAISLGPLHGGNGISISNKIYNNTIYNTYLYGIQLTGSGSSHPNRVHSNEIINNIVYRISSGPGISIKNNVQVGFNTFKNNLFFSSATNNVVDYRGKKMSCLNFNGSNKNKGDIISNNNQANPLFIDHTVSNFALQAGSPCIDTGINVNLTTDYSRNPVPQGSRQNIGAIEGKNLNISIPQNLRIVK